MMIPFKEAQEIINLHANSFGEELIEIDNCFGRVLAENIQADRDYPPFNRSAMDGFAINVVDFENGINNFKIAEDVFAGQVSNYIIKEKECYKIMTGAPVPESANVVIRREDTEETSDSIIIKIQSLKKYQNISIKGEDIKSNEIILKSGQVCNHSILTALASIGKRLIKVQKLPTVAIFSTGNEIKPLNQDVLPYQIHDSNSYTIEAMLRQFLIKPTIKNILPDDEEILFQYLKNALDCNIIIISGGVSAGDADFIPNVLEKIGVKKIFHKVAIKPGKPFWCGKMPNGGLVFALPGNPMSCQVCFKLFIEPYLIECFGLSQKPIFKISLLEQKLKKVKLDEFFPCYIQSNPYGLLQTKFNGSGGITSTLDSHGLAIHKTKDENLEAGFEVDFLLW